jgi:hypothetical protein
LLLVAPEAIDLPPLVKHSKKLQQLYVSETKISESTLAKVSETPSPFSPVAIEIANHT